MKHLLITLLCLFTFACQSGNTKSAQPAWIENPQDGAVSSCTTHVQGRQAQEELAISRARARLAARMGVTVEQVSVTHEKVVNDAANVSKETMTRETIKNNTVKARVRETWYDRKNDTIWVWLYPVK